MNTPSDEDVRVVPFSYSQHEFQADIVKKMCESDTMPTDVFKKAEKKLIRRFYFPVRVYEGSYDGRWTAQEGHDEERLVVRGDERSFLKRQADCMWSGNVADAQKRPDHLTSEVHTTWHHISGFHEGSFEILGVANDNNQGMAATIKTLFGSYSKDYLHELDICGGSLESVSPDIQIIQPSVSAESYWAKTASNEVNKVAEHDMQCQFSGMKVRNFSLHLSKSHTSYIVYIPVWVFGFVYNGETYCLMMDEGRKKLEGKLPSTEELTKEIKEHKESKDAVGGWGCFLFLAVPAAIGFVFWGANVDKNSNDLYMMAALCALAAGWMLYELRKEKMKAAQMGQLIAERARERKSAAHYLFDTAEKSYRGEDQTSSMPEPTDAKEAPRPVEEKPKVIQPAPKPVASHAAVMKPRLVVPSVEKAEPKADAAIDSSSHYSTPQEEEEKTPDITVPATPERSEPEVSNTTIEKQSGFKLGIEWYVRIAIFALLALVAWGSSHSAGEAVDHLLVLCVLFVIYFLPTLLAFHFKHPHRWFILAVDAVLGWAGVGWIIALVWCFVGRRKQK